MGLQDKIEQHPLGALLVVAVVVASATWGFLDQVLVRPRDEEFARLQRRMEELEAKEQALPSAPISQPNESEESETPPLANAASEPRVLEQSTVARDIRTPSGTGGPAPSSIEPQASQSEPVFQTESYRLEVVEVKKSGTTVRVTMALEALYEGSFPFRAGGWYLLDEKGERWNEFKLDPALVRNQRREGLQAPFRDGIRLVPGTKVKDNLVFNAAGSGMGANFTLIAIESKPQADREIVLRGLVSKDG
jgi:hypothetical protein